MLQRSLVCCSMLQCAAEYCRIVNWAPVSCSQVHYNTHVVQRVAVDLHSLATLQFAPIFPKRERVDIGQLIAVWPRHKNSTEFRRHTKACGNCLPVARAIFQVVSVNQSGAVTILPVKFLFSNECFPMTNSTWNLYLQHYSYVYMHIYVCVYV